MADTIEQFTEAFKKADGHNGSNFGGIAGEYTQQLCAKLRERFPTKNVMICLEPFKHDFTDVTQLSATWINSFMSTQHWNYTVLIFRSGHFEKLGRDGSAPAEPKFGFEQWCFGGNYQKDGFKVEFFDGPLPTLPNPLTPRPHGLPVVVPVPVPVFIPVPVPILVPSQPAPSDPKDGVFLVNSEKNGEWTSGFAWYSNISGNKDGNRPNAYIDIPGHGAGSGKGPVTWEGYSNSGTFADGNKFYCTIDLYAHTDKKPLYSVVGTAGNNFRKMKVHKDRYRQLYEIDGWKVYTVYYCQ